MTSPSAILTIIRLARPHFRSNEDKLAFAVHAYVLANGYKLVATGAAAEQADPSQFEADSPEVDIHGWNGLDDIYSFIYQDAEGQRDPMHLRAILAGTTLLVQWSGFRTPAAAPVNVLDLDVAHFSTENPTAPQAYKNIDQLIKILDDAFPIEAARSPRGAAQGRSGGREEATEERSRGEYEDLLQEGAGFGGFYQRPGTTTRFPEVPSTGVGYDDVVPPGVRAPGLIPGGGIGELIAGPSLREAGGGMHVGPGHPIFGPGKPGVVGPPELGGGPLPPGARWDPIGPPGTRGFRPDEVHRDPSQPHPDMAQPGPGKGTDWDAFYG